MKRILAVVAALVIAALAIGLHIRANFGAVTRLFKRNAELKAQGYYMGEFEFKMVAVQYYLNEGSYLKAYTTLRRIRREMETTQGLVRMPDVGSPQQMTAFLLERQDPATGAFMDVRYPFFTYISPTLNVVGTLDDLARNAGQPLKLKYPLRFLDQIGTSQQLRAFLDSHLYLKETWARLGGPGPYAAVSELAYFDELERAGVYRFSDEWKNALRQWFYETQDPATGFWGTRVGNPGKWRQNIDANSTYHVVHLVLDDRGDNQSAQYPLRYAGVLAQNLLRVLDRPVPDDPQKQHSWSLEQAQGARMITRLWPHLSDPDKELGRRAMQTYLTQRYRFFRPADGGFSLYTTSTRADVDGTANALGLLRATGCLSGTWERDRLWGNAIAAAPKPTRTEVLRWEDVALPVLPNVRSLRVYKNVPPPSDAYDDANLLQIIYPRSVDVLDVMDVRQRVAGFIAASGQAFGNWTPKESLREPLGLRRAPRAIPVSHGRLDLARIAMAHSDTRRFCVIGYDVFQVPVLRVQFVRRVRSGRTKSE
jgi:hypothetical protein